MVESTALEMRRTGNRTVGSNPTLSAITRCTVLKRAANFRKSRDSAIFDGASRPNNGCWGYQLAQSHGRLQARLSANGARFGFARTGNFRLF